MKTTPCWASIALLRVQAVFAQSTATTTASSTTTSASPSCTASLITSICSYPEPGSEFAVASDGKAYCWDYCNSHTPCNFVIFVAGNPTTGTGTCWLYPGQTYNASAGSSECSNPTLSVYSQPVCSGGSTTATTTSGACAATATPSAVASVCGYPAPDDCFDDCVSSGGASDCLSLCASSTSCSYVVFNPQSSDNSQYASGTCWIYPNGTYDAASAATCSGDPTQFVYDNACPKPTSTSPSPSSATAAVDVAGAADAPGSSTTSSKNLAPTTLSHTNPLAIGMALLLWQGLQ